MNPLKTLISFLYHKYVYAQEQEEELKILTNLEELFRIPTRKLDKVEMAMIEKEYYQRDGKLH